MNLDASTAHHFQVVRGDKNAERVVPPVIDPAVRWRSAPIGRTEDCPTMLRRHHTTQRVDHAVQLRVVDLECVANGFGPDRFHSPDDEHPAGAIPVEVGRAIAEVRRTTAHHFKESDRAVGRRRSAGRLASPIKLPREACIHDRPQGIVGLRRSALRTRTRDAAPGETYEECAAARSNREQVSRGNLVTV